MQLGKTLSITEQAKGERTDQNAKALPALVWILHQEKPGWIMTDAFLPEPRFS